MGTADKTYSNVDKKTAEILKEAKFLLEEKGYVVSKPRKKSIARELMNGAYAKAAGLMIKDKVPDLTVRKICMKAIEDKFFDECLDTLVMGPSRRAAFDNQSEKTWTEKTATADIETKGQFKRFKLIERYIELDMNMTRTLFDPDYRPSGDKVVIKKRKYTKTK
jgi:hypothetical protein